MRFIYIGRVSHKMSDAASIRVHNIGNALKLKNHQVDYICQEGVVPNGKTEENGSICYGVFNEKTGKISMWIEWFLGSKAARRLEKMLRTEHYDGVILYNVPYIIARKTLRLCRKYGVTVFNDVTEWYEIDRSKGLVSYMYAWLVDRRIRLFDPKCDGVIAISQYLENYYKEIVPLINMPPVFEGEGYENISQNSIPRFLYAGSPSKKDELYNVIEAIKQLNADGVRVEITLIGAPIPDNSEKLRTMGICYFPRMSHKEVLTVLKEHDFTVLVRRAARYAKAGYSTKIAESLHNGTPVFCNEIGGADMDIQTGFNGVKITSADIDTIKKELLQIIQMSSEEIAEMKKNAFSFGKEKYSLENYVEDLDAFFTNQARKRI